VHGTVHVVAPETEHPLAAPALPEKERPLAAPALPETEHPLQLLAATAGVLGQVFALLLLRACQMGVEQV
jgi:hypothetical protein